MAQALDNSASPPLDGTSRPVLSRTQSSASAASTSRRNSIEIDGIDITSGLPTAGLPLSDLLQTYLAPRLDLFDRRLRKYGDDIRRRSKYDELVRRSRDKKEELGMRQELKKLRGKVGVCSNACAQIGNHPSR